MDRSHFAAAILGAATVLCLSAALRQDPEKIGRNSARDRLESRLLELEEEIAAGAQDKSVLVYRMVLRGLEGQFVHIRGIDGVTFLETRKEADHKLTYVGGDFVSVTSADGHVSHYPMSRVVVNVRPAK